MRTIGARDLRDIAVIVAWDLRKLARQTVFVAMRTTWFVLQVLVFGYAISRIVSLPGVNYYDFYLLGVYTALLYSVGVARGYDIADEFDEGIVEYHLSLPVKRSSLAVGRVLGGSISTFLFTLPMMAFVLAMVGPPDPAAVAASLASAFAFSLGVVGLVISVVLSVKSTDATDILFGALDALLVRLSTVFYPAPILAKVLPYYYAALANPISHMSDLLRIALLPESAVIAMAPWPASAAYVAGLAVGLSYLALYIFSRRLEAGGWR